MNAKEEFLDHTEFHRDNNGLVIKAAIVRDCTWEGDGDVRAALKVGYTEDDLVKFLNGLDFIYDSGYGGQELSGYIWYEDGTWSERGEYDGSEWWEYKAIPHIPEELK